MDLVLLGAPGSGKGTVSGALINRYGFVQLSTGDMLRKAVKDETPLGLEIKRYMDAGQFVPDQLVVDLVAERLKNGGDSAGYILDGFPRTITQAEALKTILKELDMQLDCVIELRVSDDVVIERITNRRTCSNAACQRVYNIKSFPPKKEGICDSCGSEIVKRADEDVVIVKQRLVDYAEKTNFLVDFYKKEGILNTIDDLDFDIILQKIDAVLKKYK